MKKSFPIRKFLRSLRSLKAFLFFILPVSIFIGLLLPDAAGTLNSLGLTLIQLISFPAIPLVLTAVIISSFSILTISTPSASGFKFTKRLILALLAVIISISLFSLILALYQKPGMLSPVGRFSIGSFMLDVTDIRLSIKSVAATQVDPFEWAKQILPNNILTDASQGQTLKVITGSLLLGWGLSLMPQDKSKPLVSVLRSIYDLSVKVLDELLLIAPFVVICLISGAIATISSEIVFALLNLTICMVLASVASLGISRLIFKRYTTSDERSKFDSNPVDSVFLLGLSTGSSMACYPAIVRTLNMMDRNISHSEASASLSLLVARMGNILYNIIAIMFAINLFEVSITPALLIQILILGIVTGISAAGLNGVAVVPTISVALIALQIPVPPVLVLLLAIDPILTLPRAATTAVLSLAISVISADSDAATNQKEAQLEPA